MWAWACKLWHTCEVRDQLVGQFSFLRASQTPWSWSYGWLWAARGILGAKSRSFAKTTSAPSPQASSPVPVASRAQTQDIRFVCKYLYLLSHLARPSFTLWMFPRSAVQCAWVLMWSWTVRLGGLFTRCFTVVPPTPLFENEHLLKPWSRREVISDILSGNSL